jgi:hypothetical protein
MFATHVERTAYAQQRSASNPRFEVKPAGTLDGSAGAIRAAFLRDTKTGDCWLWVDEISAGPALAAAKPLACE